MIKKYGKNVDMRNVNRNISKIKHMIKDVKESSINNLVEFDLNEQYKCRICHHIEYNFFMNIYGYQYCECNRCKSIFLANIPDTKKLYQGIPNIPIDLYIDKDLFEKRVEMIAEPKIEFILNVAKKIGVKIEQWVDIGCGTGEILYVLNKRGYSTIGIESDLREVDFARRENDLNVIEGFVDYVKEEQEINNAIESSSVISLFNVLEHIDKPDEFINYIYRHMPINSLLVFEVPKHPSLASFANLTSNTNIYRHIVPPIHLQVFSDEGVNSLLKNKFELIATWGFGQGFFDILTNAVIISNIENLELYNNLLDASNNIQKVIDENNFSDQMIFIAQKI